MSQDNTQNQTPATDIILTAIQSIDSNSVHSPEDFTRAVIARSITISKMFNDKGLVMRALDSVRIYCDIKKIELEESSQRYVITFKAYNDDSDDTEIIRSPRMDTSDGRILKPIIQKALDKLQKTKHCKCVLYKNNEQLREEDKKKAGKSKIPASGYRTFVWIDLFD